MAIYSKIVFVFVAFLSLISLSFGQTCFPLTFKARGSFGLTRSGVCDGVAADLFNLKPTNGRRNTRNMRYRSARTPKIDVGGNSYLEIALRSDCDGNNKLPFRIQSKLIAGSLARDRKWIGIAKYAPGDYEDSFITNRINLNAGRYRFKLFVTSFGDKDEVEEGKNVWGFTARICIDTSASISASISASQSLSASLSASLSGSSVAPSSAPASASATPVPASASASASASVSASASASASST